MLPFATVEFYMLFALVVAALFLVKAVIGSRVKLGSALLVVSLGFAIVYYPKPIQLLAFTAYQCLFCWFLLFKWQRLHKLLGSLLLALPMVLVKFNVETELLSFAGLSYITFRCVQVYLDGELVRERFTFCAFITFLLFTPSLLVGPIDRYERFKTDLDDGWSRLNKASFTAGWELMVLGLLHKFVLAELADRFWLSRIPAESVAVIDMTNSMYAYTVYLYFDFAGYSLLAMGLGRMMGIALPFNFDRPWLVSNPPEFWKRWHVSLGDWLRDYFFRPIYKNLSGVQRLRTWPLLRQNIALFSTFLLMGCWNGIEPHYIVSGALFGLYSVVYNSYQHLSRKHQWNFWGSLPEKAVRLISIVIMVNLCCFALYIFSGRFPYLH
ncbi:MAG: MBOAT family O-acyltransferase [Flavobacteriales bacterium]